MRSFLLSVVLASLGALCLRADGNHPVPGLTASAADDPAFLAQVLARSADTRRATAIERAVQVIKLRPENADNWVRLGETLRQFSRDTLDFTLYRVAERSYLRATQLDASNAGAFAGLAWAAGASHRFDDSVKAARQALQIDAQCAEAYGLIGDAAVEAGDYDEAEENYSRMLELRPGLASFSRVGHLVFLQGNPSAAMSWLRRAIQVGGEQPEHVAWCVAELANILCRQGAPQLALRELQAPRLRLPDNLALLTAEGRARAAAGEDDRAIAILELAVTQHPQHETLALLHDLYLSQGRAEDARRIGAEIEALHRRLEEAFVFGGEGQLARFYADRGENLPAAVMLAEREYGHHKTIAATDTLAWAYFRAGRVGDTRRLVSSLLKRGCSDAAALYHIGLIEAAQGKVGAARQHLYGALSREPRFNPLHAPLAQRELDRLAQLPSEPISAEARKTEAHR